VAVGNWSEAAIHLGRYGLGLAQMIGAVAGLVLIFAEGLTPASIAVVAVTSLLTALSRWLFPRDRSRS
jgi:hypothetical protein